MSLVIETIDKSKGLVTQPKELNEIHRGVLEILDTKKFSQLPKEEVKQDIVSESEKSVPTLGSLKLRDALLSARTSLLFGPRTIKKETTSEILDRVVNIRLIDNEENKRYKKQQLNKLIKKIEIFVNSDDKTKESFDEIINGIDETITYLNIICESTEELCNCKNYLSGIRYKLMNLYSDKLGIQKVR